MTSVPPGGTGEHRWPAVAAVLVALALYLALPSTFLPGLRYAVAATAVALLVPLVAVNPVRLHHQTRWSRRLSLAQTLLLAIANQVALVVLVVSLVASSEHSGGRLLLAAAQVWLTNVIAFALVLWEIDRGGPVVRRALARDSLPAADLRFPQDEDHDAIDEVAARSSGLSDWRPRFGDYLYTSLSNSMAFSASDAIP
ncbi:MAG: hypothetical protein ACK4MD_06080, partial [Demequina sp.]